MLKVGLTGGMASGKSAVAAEFTRLAVPVVDADTLAHELTVPGSPGLSALVAALGPQILDPKGMLDRAGLRSRLIAETDLRRQVEAIVHPRVIGRLKELLAKWQAPYGVAVIPLLVEHPEARALVDRVLVVDCPESIQIARLMARDGGDQASARAMLSLQASRARRLAAGDDILENTGRLDALGASVGTLHRLYEDMARHPARRQPGLRLP